MTNTPKPEALACPCCQSASQVVPHWADIRVRYRVVCEHCGLKTDNYKSEAEAIAAWNTRASAAPVKNEALASLVERLRFCEEHGLFIASLNDSVASYGEAATTITTLAAERDALRESLKWYAHQFCELGTSHECCGRMTSDDCSGCLARTTLERTAQP